VQRVHAGSHRCRDRETEEEELDDELQLPEREREGDDADGDDRGDERSAGRLCHIQGFLAA